MTITQYENVSSIINNYDAFIIDLWGVIHDGMVAYPGVNECLQEIKNAEKTILFLSNAPRRAAKAIEGLQRVGVPDNLYDHVITSGEVTFEYARDNKLGKKYYMIGPERDAGLFDGLKYERTHKQEDADFVIVTGFEDDDSTLEERISELEECLKHNLPMICANPDLVVVRQTGVRALCAGVIANKYSEMGGKVTQFGKPYPQVYKKCFEYFKNTPKNKIAAIGDSLITDIKGANEVGITSYLIAGGILGEELGIEHGQLPPLDKLDSICDREGAKPDSVLPAFIW